MKNTQRINSKTKIYGIIGYPLSHTLSPVIHNGLFKEYDYDGLYLVFENDKPQDILSSLRKALPIKGLSVTIPFKEWAYSISNKPDEASSIMSSTNTLIFENNDTYAYNTDGEGAVRSILRYFPGFFSSGKEGDILILGSGGSARGIAFAILKQNLKDRKIAICGRNKEKSEEILKLLNSIQPNSAYFISVEDLQKNRDKFSMVINTTPVGMKGNQSPQIITGDFFLKSHILFDIVYNPIKTPLVKSALKNKSIWIPGYEMLLYQAMLQFELFTGIKPEEERVEKVRRWLIGILNKRS